MGNMSSLRCLLWSTYGCKSTGSQWWCSCW